MGWMGYPWPAWLLDHLTVIMKVYSNSSHKCYSLTNLSRGKEEVGYFDRWMIDQKWHKDLDNGIIQKIFSTRVEGKNKKYWST